MTIVYAAVRLVLGHLEELFDDSPRISRDRAELECQRQEWNRHPVERFEPERGMDGPHFPLGHPVRPGELRKRPVFER